MNLESYSRHLVMLAFDSYFEHLPDGSVFTLPAVEGSDIILPRLGIRVPTSGQTAALRRLGPESLEVRVNGQRLSINLGSVDAEYRLPTLQVPGQDSALVLMARDPALFEEDYINTVSSDQAQATSLVERIGKSLDLIAEVDPELSLQLNSLVKWYTPVITPDPNTIHNSFTARWLLGVMFVSGTYKFLPLLEAIVHEYHHAELFMLMATQDVLGSSLDKLFYSPWRNDARPLHGLFHALHVFSGVADFYSRAENTPSLKAYKEHIASRRIQLCYQLRLGLAQVPKDDLSPLGRSIYEFMKGQLKRHETAIGPLSPELPDEIATHLKNWIKRYPELALELQIPPEVQMPNELSASN
jgi:HEXXH motif-containing protein